MVSDFGPDEQQLEAASVCMLLQNTRGVSLEQVAARVGVPDDLSSLPKVVMSVGPCRSGTTVFLRVFAASGIQSSGKPLKVVLRWLLQEPDDAHIRTWSFPTVPAIYLKESIGPYSRLECEFDPLQVLFKVVSGREGSESKAIERLREKVSVLITGRNPAHSWVSWMAKYGQFVPRTTLFQHFLIAHETAASVRTKAIEWGLSTSHYVLEAHLNATTAVPRLFSKLGLPNTPVITGWKKLPPFPSEESGIEIPDQPAVYDRTGRFDKILNSDGLSYFGKSGTELATITDDESRIMCDRIEPLYAVWRRDTEIDLGITLPSVASRGE